MLVTTHLTDEQRTALTARIDADVQVITEHLDIATALFVSEPYADLATEFLAKASLLRIIDAVLTSRDPGLVLESSIKTAYLLGFRFYESQLKALAQGTAA